tara:strand:+ start:179 stop:358 length:180 start_codon:yes stop_codon:yes gene_type:complete
MSDYKMNYLPDDDDSQQEMEASEREEYEREYEEWLDSLDKKWGSKLVNINKEQKENINE